MTGQGPCDACKCYIENIPLTGESFVRPLLGRLFYPAMRGAVCPNCGAKVYGVTAYSTEQLSWDLSSLSNSNQNVSRETIEANSGR